jgi:hypothetical protein
MSIAAARRRASALLTPATDGKPSGYRTAMHADPVGPVLSWLALRGRLMSQVPRSK